MVDRMLIDIFLRRVACAVIWEHPTSGHLGEYDSTQHLIRLHPELTGVQAWAVLTHELGHAAYRHDRSTALTERQANEIADWLRIPFCRFMQTIKMYETVQAVAHELDVLPSDIRRYTQRLTGCPNM